MLWIGVNLEGKSPRGEGGGLYVLKNEGHLYNLHCQAMLGFKQGKGIYFRGTWEQRPNFEGNREKRQYLGTGNIRKQNFDFWGNEKQANLFQGNKGTGTPWEGLNEPFQSSCRNITICGPLSLLNKEVEVRF